MTDKNNETSSKAARNLSILVAVYFLVEALCQPDGFIYQSIAAYLHQVLNWDADAVTNFYSLMSVPLLARPIYGVLCDVVPLFGYRRKTWLAAFMLLNTIGFASLIFVASPILVCTALCVASVGVAAGSTLASAVIVENGNKHDNTGSLINQQWFWFNLGILVFAQAGGVLAAHISVKHGFHTAAIAAAVAPMLVMWASMRLLDEQRADHGINKGALKQALLHIKTLLGTRTIYVTFAFIAVYNLSPLMPIPLLFQLRSMHISENFIGLLLALSAVGSMAASYLYKKLEARLTLKQLLILGVMLGVVGKLLYLLLLNQWFAIPIWFFNGVFSMLILIPCLRLAALRCPTGLEAFTYGLLTCSLTGSRIVSNTAASWLYEHAFHSHLALLVLIGAVAAAVALPFAMRLKISEQKQQ